MAVQLSQLLSQSYDILRESQADVSAYPVAFMTQLLNSAQLRICAGRITDVRTNTKIRKGVLPFLTKRQFIESILSTSITTEPAIGATTLEVSETNDYPTAGILWVAGNLVTYTGKTSTTFTGCTNVLFPFPVGTRVYPSFELNDDFLSMTAVSYNNAMPLPFKNEKEVYRDLVPAMKGYRPLDIVQASTSTPIQYTRLNPFYTLWEGKFQPFFVDNTGGMFVLQYEKKPTTMVDPTDEVIIPDDDVALSTIPYLAVGEMLFNRGEGDYALTLLSFAYAQISDFYSMYNDIGSEDSDGSEITYGKIYFNV